MRTFLLSAVLAGLVLVLQTAAGRVSAQSADQIGSVEATRIVIGDPDSGQSIVIGMADVTTDLDGGTEPVFGIHIRDSSGDIRATFGLMNEDESVLGLFGDEGLNGFYAFADPDRIGGYMIGDFEGGGGRLIGYADEDNVAILGQSRNQGSRYQLLLADDRVRIRAFGGDVASLEATVAPEDGAFLAMSNASGDGQVAILGAMETPSGPYTIFGASEAGAMLDGSSFIGSDSAWVQGEGGVDAMDVISGLGLALDGICLLSRRC